MAEKVWVRGAPPASHADKARHVQRVVPREQVHQGEEVAGIPAAAQHQLGRHNLVGHDQPAADVGLVGPGVEVLQVLGRRGFVA